MRKLNGSTLPNRGYGNIKTNNANDKMSFIFQTEYFYTVALKISMSFNWVFLEGCFANEGIRSISMEVEWRWAVRWWSLWCFGAIFSINVRKTLLDLSFILILSHLPCIPRLFVLLVLWNFYLGFHVFVFQIVDLALQTSCWAFYALIEINGIWGYCSILTQKISVCACAACIFVDLCCILCSNDVCRNKSNRA